MTMAVCVKCGSIKYGAFNHCQECGLRRETEIDLAYSFALTDHHFSVDVLRQISSDMKRGAPRPSLPPQQEDYMRGAARSLIVPKASRLMHCSKRRQEKLPYAASSAGPPLNLSFQCLPLS
jgi:hypothetical protein